VKHGEKPSCYAENGVVRLAAKRILYAPSDWLQYSKSARTIQVPLRKKPKKGQFFSRLWDFALIVTYHFNYFASSFNISPEFFQPIAKFSKPKPNI